MPYFETELEVDVDDFLSSCTKSEIKELIEALQEDGWLIKESVAQTDKMNLLDEEWLNVTNKLNNIRLRLSVEEEQTIKDIVNRY
jgi:hypothetical protein